MAADEMTELSTMMSKPDKFKWSGNSAQLQSFVKNLLITDGENNDESALSCYECTPLSVTITLYENKTVQFQGQDKEKIEQLILSIIAK